MIHITIERINVLNFIIFILLLPFCALGYFYNIFHSWSANASLYPLLIGVVLLSVNFLTKGKIYTNKNLNYLLAFCAISFVGTSIMSLVIANFLHIYNGTMQEIYSGVIKRIFTISIIFLSVYYTAFSAMKISHKLIIRIIYLSFVFVLIYGYIQILAMFFPFSLWYKLYMSIQEHVNFGWVGLNEGYNKILQIYINGGRIILTTQEPSVAGYLLTTFYYPFLLSSMIIHYSVYEIKLLRKSVEFMLFIASLPIVFFTFSTSTYIVVLIEIIFAGFLYYRELSLSKIIKFCFYVILLCISVLILYKILPQSYIDNISSIFEKIFMSGKGSGSAQTRYGFMYAGFLEFIHYPLLGVGLGNSKYIFAKYIPNWAYNSEVISYLSTGSALGSKGFWSLLLSETGILGTLTFILFLYSLFRKYLSLKLLDKENLYLKYTFIMFLISFFLQGFNSAALFFIWQWALFGFFIGFSDSVRNGKESLCQ